MNEDPEWQKVLDACDALLDGGCSTIGVATKAMHARISGAMPEYLSGDAGHHAPHFAEAFCDALRAIKDQRNGDWPPRD